MQRNIISSPCPVCDKMKHPESEPSPVPGAIVFCVYCAACLVYDRDMIVRRAMADDLLKLDPEKLMIAAFAFRALGAINALEKAEVQATEREAAQETKQ